MSTITDESRATARWRHRALAERRWSTISLYIGITLLVMAVVAAVSAPWLAPADPNQIDLGQRLLAPSVDHVMGTDSLGRDIASRVVFALRVDLEVIFVITYVPLVIGMTVGAIAGYSGGLLESVTMRAVDAVIALPFLVIVIAIVAIAGAGLKGVYIGVPLVAWTLYARLTRGEMLVVREQEYMHAAKALGYSRARIVLRHAIPNVLSANLVFSAADLVLNLVLLASLSYLGLGVQPPTAELGGMVADGQSVLLQAWWVATFPGVCIVILGVSFSLIGDGVADRLGKEFRLGL